jgi:hypothetical protein
MEFEWSEAKRQWVLQERGIDFIRVASALFDGRPILTVPSPRGGSYMPLENGRASFDFAQRLGWASSALPWFLISEDGV